MSEASIRRLGPGDEAVLALLAHGGPDFDIAGRTSPELPPPPADAAAYLADPAVLRVSCRSDAVSLQVDDDGTVMPTGKGDGAGLAGLEERARHLNGTEVARGDQVVAAARAHDADVALLDIEMPGLDGISAAAQLARAISPTHGR